MNTKSISNRCSISTFSPKKLTIYAPTASLNTKLFHIFFGGARVVLLIQRILQQLQINFFFLLKKLYQLLLYQFFLSPPIFFFSHSLRFSHNPNTKQNPIPKIKLNQNKQILKKKKKKEQADLTQPSGGEEDEWWQGGVRGNVVW